MPNQNQSSSSNSNDADIPNEFCCIITGDIMTEPVIAADGYTYEKTAIVKWLVERQNKSPITRQVIDPNILIPNRILKTLIENYTQNNPTTSNNASSSNNTLILTNNNSNTTTTNSSSGNSNTFFSNNISNEKTHLELMQKLAEDLKVDYSEVYVGSAVEQTLVGYAGVYEDQSASFYRRGSNGTTYFQLNLTEASYNELIKFYDQRHIGFIKNKEKINDNVYKITTNTMMLYQQLSPKLGEFREKSHTELMEVLKTWLKVEWDDVYKGDAVESTLVKMAGINDVSQKEASFRRNPNYSTVFNLKLDGENYPKFTNYYQQQFPGLILSHAKASDGFVTINVNTLKLRKEVAPKLGEYKESLQNNNSAPLVN